MTSPKWYLMFVAAYNILLLSNASYVRTPPNNDSLRGVLKRSLELQCDYTGIDGGGEFVEWYKDDVPVSKEIAGHYVVRTTDKVSMLIIKIFVAADAAVNKWYVKTTKAGYEGRNACEFSQIPLISSPQGIETGRSNEILDSPHESIRRGEESSVTFRCLIKPDPKSDADLKAIRWEFSRNDNEYSRLLTEEIETTGDTLTIDHVKKTHRGYYRCTLNDVSFSVLLRVKDRYAVLWPIIGIASIVLTLGIVILIFEKRQSTTKRNATTDDDDNDHANDPLVRSSTKTSDNESKKRAVKA